VHASRILDRVNLVRSLYDRWQSRLHEVTAFGVIGGVNFVIDLLLFNLFYSVFGIPLLTAKVFSTIISATTSYFMNRRWTFKDRTDSGRRREYMLFFFFNAAGLGIQLAILGLFKFILGLDTPVWANVGNVLGVAAAMVFRFWTYSKFVFLASKTEEAAGEQEKEPSPV
jgi:putative flippase GtrA